MDTLIVPFLEVKEDSANKGRIKGYGSTFGNVDLGKDICEKGCFSRSLKEHSANGTLPSLYYMHDRREPVGDWLSVGEDSKGLVVEGQLWLDDDIEAARKSYKMLKGTGPKGLSIGYVTRQSSYDEKTGVRTLKDVDLLEISIVGYGMNPKAKVTSVKSLFTDGALPTIREMEAHLRDVGFSNSQAKALLADGYKALRRDDALPENAEAEIQAILRLTRTLRGEEPCA